jgi:hypothetical protein
MPYFESPAPPPKTRQRVIIGALLAIVLAGGVISYMRSGGAEPERQSPSGPTIVNITLPPPPLPPPPPPPPPPPQNEPPPAEEEMLEQPEIVEAEAEPDEAPAPEAPPSDIGTGLTGGDGSDGFGLTTGRGAGGSSRIGGTGTRGGGGRFGRYAATVQTSVAEALRSHPATRGATLSIQVRVWPDATGRITRVQLVGTTGNRATDEAIRNQVLTGHLLPEPPPAEMPRPIVMRISARKPAF